MLGSRGSKVVVVTGPLIAYTKRSQVDARPFQLSVPPRPHITLTASGFLTGFDYADPSAPQAHSLGFATKSA